jgi:hypothetical protein
MFGRLLSQIRSIQASRDFREFSSALPQNPSTGGIAAPPPGPQRALAGFDWTVRGARTTWAGQCFAWPFGEDWCLVTASWQTADISYTPVLLGFAARARWHRNIGEVLARTLGTVVGPEASVSTYFGFSGFEAAYIATCLHGTGSEDWENPLSALPDGDILRAIGFTEGGTIGMKVLVESLQAVRDAEAIIRDARDKSQGGTSS